MLNAYIIDTWLILELLFMLLGYWLVMSLRNRYRAANLSICFLLVMVVSHGALVGSTLYTTFVYHVDPFKVFP